MSRPNKTGFKGVYRKGDRFSAIGWVNRRCHYLGQFDTAEEASATYEKWNADPSNKSGTIRRQSDSHKEERSSPEMYEIVDKVFRRLIENDRSRSGVDL